MKLKHEGVFTVAIVTMIASAIVLFAGVGAADSTKVETITSKPVLERSDLGLQGITQSNRVHNIIVAVAPPPGPFFGLSAPVYGVIISKKAPVQPSKKIDTPLPPLVSFNTVTVPTPPMKTLGRIVELKKPVMPFAPLLPSFELNKQDAPKLVQKKLNIPLLSKAPSLRVAPEFDAVTPLESLVKNIDAPSIAILKRPPVLLQRRAIKNSIPTLNQKNFFATNNQKGMNMPAERKAPNMGVSYPVVQQYMYVPVPMYQYHFIAPQAPTIRVNPVPLASNKMLVPINKGQSARQEYKPMQDVSGFLKKDSN